MGGEFGRSAWGLFALMAFETMETGQLVAIGPQPAEEDVAICIRGWRRAHIKVVQP